ncbi:DNA-3-methyladenine glycosylase family protein [Rhodococcus coprophilus]|uniref:DNA-3-methyladenine glycosylase II n=1 Tax=Rhodococcus coprophilus TaxID=38310 RepID=A0A2X4U4N6_9NOCA|nr:AlkA N-terminal domain-containing protein [Rhodococcus coprophilus]SQI34746.1 DNA-3-methyladenine glycosylase II [Rhodococcus coprophilus]
MATLRLPVALPFAVEPLLATLRRHAVPGHERHDAPVGAHCIAIRTSRGSAYAAAKLRPDAEEVILRVDATHRSDIEEVEAAVRRWLDLDTDPALVDAAFASDAVLAPLVRARPGLRVLGSTDWFTTAVGTVLGQQVSVGAAATFAGRLVAAFGDDAPGGLRCSPTPQRLVSLDQEELRATIGTTRSRARTVHELARAACDGLDPESASFGRDLLALPGIGPWTVDYLALRTGDPDAYPAGDLVLRRALGAETTREATALAAQWRPWRAYAVAHLWAHATSDPAP